MMAAPRFVGLDLPPLPYESLRSAGARLSWRNGFSDGTLKMIYNEALWCAARDHRGARTPTDRMALHLLTEWPLGDNAEEESRQQYASAGLEGIMTGLRYCPVCLEGCYHSYLFQWTGVYSCPIHDCPLVAHCSSCGAKLAEAAFNESIGLLGYRCPHCGGPIAGAAPDLGLHLELRDHSALIEERFGSWSRRLVHVQTRIGPVRASKGVVAEQCRGSEKSWFDKQALLKAMQELVCAETNGTKGVSKSSGITLIRWRIWTSRSIFEAIFSTGRLTWRERTRGLLPVYLATRRQIENWLFGQEDVREKICWACFRFERSHDEAVVSEWEPSVLAYVLLRFTQEKFGFGNNASDACRSMVQLRDAPANITRCWIRGGLPRIVYRAWLLACFAVLRALVVRHPSMRLTQVLQLSQFPESLIPIFESPDSNDIFLTGGVFFPTIRDMPMQPFRELNSRKFSGLCSRK